MSFYRRPWVLYVFVLVLYAFLFLPILDVVVNSFNKDASMVGWGGFTIGWYRTAWGDSVVRNGALNSIIIAFISAGASAILGTAAAMAINRSRRITRAAIIGMTYARIVVPELVLALALLILLARVGFPLGIWSMALGHTVFNSAYITVIVQARLVGRDPSVDEAARDLGAPPRRVFRRVTLPDILPAIVAGSLLAFTFSLDDAVTSFFLSGSQNTLPLVILSLVRFQVTPTVNAIGTAMMLVTFVAMGAFLFVNLRWSNRSRVAAEA